MDTVENIAEGQVLNNRYEIISFIGSGAMAKVARAYDRQQDNAIVVLKFLRERWLDTDHFTRFQNEASVMSQLKHPSIVRVFNLDKYADTTYFIVMEYVEGKNLREVFLSPGLDRPDATRIFAILYRIADAVAYAHQYGIVHRDLKPDNILITPDDSIKISDFGLAKAMFRNEKLTGIREAVGTPDYMSPEQLRAEEVDGRCDMYTFGIMTYELLTGEKPFVEKNYMKLASLHLEKPVPALIVPGAPVWLNGFVQRLTAKAPADRFASMHEVALRLADYADDPKAARRHHKRALGGSGRTPIGSSVNALFKSLAGVFQQK